MTLEQNREIDRIVSAFEHALRRGESPRIEDALSRISRQGGLEIRGRLLRELLATEWEHCRQSGAPLDEEAWSARFPEAIAFIREQGALFRSRGSLSETAQPAAQDSVAGTPQPAEAAPLEVLAPLSLNDYELQRRLGRGGQGEVHLARQRSLDRQVAVKLLRAEAEGDPQHARRFLREARTLAQTRHPHIVTIHGLGRLETGGLFLVMEFVDGPDLGQQIRDREFRIDEAVSIVRQVAAAIEHAHRCGVIHRDLKPANVLWDALRGPVVTDFGLAKDLRNAQDLTLTEQLMGTPGYMAPEQADRRFGEVSERTDVYGLGAMLFALLTRRSPFVGNSLAEVLRDLTSDADPPDPAHFRPDLPEELSVLCRRCLAKQPSRRLESAEALRVQLERWGSGLALTVIAPPVKETPPSKESAPTSLGKYRLVERLGHDDTRQVWKAIAPDDRTVLLKFLPPEWLADRMKRSQFRQEVLLSSRLRHPCLAAVVETGTIDRTEFIALDYMHGESVARRLEREGAIEEIRAAEILRGIAEALHQIHQAGVIYRDLRPQNILLTEPGQPMLAEVRFSEELPPGDNLTMSGIGSVTAQYIAPELILGRTSDVASDVYTLGATLYAMVTGHAPFADASDTLSAMIQKSEGRYLDPRQHVASLSEEIVELIRACLDPKPAQRPASAEEFARRLGKIIEDARTISGHDTNAEMPAPTREKDLVWDDNVQFSAYRPKVVRPETWERLLVFAHLAELPPDTAPGANEPIEEVRQQAEQILGSQIGSFLSLTADSTAPLPRDGELTLVPSGDGLEFNPPSRTFRWTEPVHREEFRFRAAARLDGQRAQGRLSVFLGSVLIAEVNLVTRVDSRAHLDPDNRIARQNRAYRFRRIYACVAPDDQPVVEQFRSYAKSMKDTFLLAQFVSSRRGDNEERIRSADVFQLYWSRRGMASPDVEADWRFALSLRRPEFVRPLYWEDPFPVSPDGQLPTPELLALGFQRIPAVVDSDGSPCGGHTSTLPPGVDVPRSRTLKLDRVRAPRRAGEPESQILFDVPMPGARSTGEGATSHAHLEILSGPQQGRMLRLEKDRVTIGRHASSDLPVESSSVSRFHTQLVREDGRWFVEDMQSNNGTFVNGRRVEGRVALHDGEQIHLGNVVIAFRQADSSGRSMDAAAPAVAPEAPPSRGAVSQPPDFAPRSEGILSGWDDLERMKRMLEDDPDEDALPEIATVKGLPREIGGCVIVEQLAQGAAGMTCTARRSDGSLVVLKTFHAGPGPYSHATFQLRKRLSHPGIVDVFDAGVWPGGRYLIREYVAGDSVRALLESGPLSPRRAAFIVQRLADALQFAHSEGWCHGLLMPKDLLVAAGDQPKIEDLRRFDEVAAGRRTDEPLVVGNPWCLSPEAITQNGHSGISADVYGLGIVLYHLVTCRAPFEGPTMELLQAIVTGRPTPPRQFQPTIDRRLEQIILRCLARSPEKRYPTAEAVSQALAQYLSSGDESDENFWRRAWTSLTRLWSRPSGE